MVVVSARRDLNCTLRRFPGSLNVEDAKQLNVCFLGPWSFFFVDMFRWEVNRVLWEIRGKKSVILPRKLIGLRTGSSFSNHKEVSDAQSSRL